MKFHFYGQKVLTDLPDDTTIQDLRVLMRFNRIIKNVFKMERIERRKENESA